MSILWVMILTLAGGGGRIHVEALKIVLKASGSLVKPRPDVHSAHQGASLWRSVQAPCCAFRPPDSHPRVLSVGDTSEQWGQPGSALQSLVVVCRRSRRGERRTGCIT